MKKSNKINTVKTQHTPAPWGMELIESGEYSSDWRVSYTFNPGTFGPGSPSIKHRICDVPYTRTAQGLADVCLIRAAPELLEALRNLLLCADAGDLDSLANASETARDVINLATGQQ